MALAHAQAVKDLAEVVAGLHHFFAPVTAAGRGAVHKNGGQLFNYFFGLVSRGGRCGVGNGVGGHHAGYGQANNQQRPAQVLFAPLLWQAAHALAQQLVIRGQFIHVLPSLVTAGLFQAAYMGGETLKIKNLLIIENYMARGLLCLRFFTKNVVF